MIRKAQIGRACITILVVASVSPFTQATDRPSDEAGPVAMEFTVDAAVERALAMSPDLRLGAMEAEKAAERARWAGRAADPELGLSFSTDRVGLNEGERSLEVAFEQAIPRRSRLRAERELAESTTVVVETDVLVERRALAREVREKAIRLLAIGQMEVLLKKQVALNQTIVGFLESRLQFGEASQLDVTQARLEEASLARELSALRVETAQLEGELTWLLYLQPGQRLSLSGGLPLPPVPADRHAEAAIVINQRPDLALALKKQDAAEAAKRLALAERKTEVTLGMFAERERGIDEPEGPENNTILGIYATIPLRIRQRNQAAIAGATLEAEMARARVTALKRRIELEVQAAMETRRRALALATEASGDSLVRAQRNLEDFQIAYAEGKASLLQVQRAQEKQLELKTAALELARDYHLADAELRHVLATGMSHAQPPSAAIERVSP